MKKSNKDVQTILVGMSGRVDSTVAAYLLKRQGHNVIGLGMSFFDHKILWPGEEMSGQGCHVDDLEKVKKICDQIGIPFYAAKADKEFNEIVLQELKVRKLSGKSMSTCVFCNYVKVKVLFEKAKKLGIEIVATGHYAKAILDTRTNNYSLGIPEEVSHDQSYLLAKIDKKLLGNMLFPLADISRDEVIKLGKKIIPGIQVGDHGRPPCFIKDPNLPKFIERNVSIGLLKPGHLIKKDDKTIVGDHTGIHHYYLGQKKIVTPPGTPPIDGALMVVGFDVTKAEVLLGHETEVISSTAMMVCNDLSIIDISTPSSVFVRIGQQNQKLKAKVYYKNSNYAIISFNEEIDILKLGECISVFTGDGCGDTVMFSGWLQNVDFVDLSDVLAGVAEKIKTLEEEEEEVDEDEKKERIVEIKRFYL